MLSGFNNNFRYRGVLFHVQTEDSGVSNPHVITHLFHGGNILASDKLDYSGKLGLSAGELEDAVRELMESQHKAMLKRLQRGLHDPVILERLGPGVFSETSASESSDTDASFVDSDDSGVADAADTSAGLTPPTAEMPVVDPAAGDSAAPDEAAAPRGFGEGVVTQKPLDEVVLEYLVENARKRKRRNQ
jgi:hypothetical protein